MSGNIYAINKTSAVFRKIIEGLRIFSVLCYPKNKEKRKAFREKITDPLFLKKRIFNGDKEFDARQIPLFIISYNRLQYLKQMLESLEPYGFSNIHIIDNKSTYPPLLEYLKSLPCHVHFMDKNYGHKVLWNSGLFDDIVNNSPYIVTDPDIELNKNMPQNFMQELYRILGEYPHISKVGLAIKIDDLPENEQNTLVKQWENAFWQKKTADKQELYFADIDTSFALYRPGKLDKNTFYKAMRLAGDFTCRHLPWYAGDTETEEDIFYKQTAKADAASWLKDSERYVKK